MRTLLAIQNSTLTRAEGQHRLLYCQLCTSFQLVFERQRCKKISGFTQHLFLRPQPQDGVNGDGGKSAAKSSEAQRQFARQSKDELGEMQT